MSTAFQLVALPAERFAPLFDLTDVQLHAMGARRVVVDEKPGFPCRVSLADRYLHVHNAGPGCYNCGVVRV